MADSIMEAAKAEYRQLKEQRDELSAKVDDMERRLEDLEEFFNAAKTISPSFKSPLDSERPRVKSNGANTKTAVLNLAGRLLVGGKRLPTREILAAAEKEGIKVGGKSEKNRILNISSIISRSRNFVTGPDGWALKQEEIQLPKGEARGGKTPRASVAARAADPVPPSTPSRGDHPDRRI
jgi:hypothetical protein